MRPVPDDQRFYLDRGADLAGEITRLGLDLPLAGDYSSLARSLALGGITLANRLCADPLGGGDAGREGAPSRLTHRRYRQLARGGFGLIWFETTWVAADPELTGPHSLKLDQATLPAFAGLTDKVRAEAAAAGFAAPALILQLDHPQPARTPCDEIVGRYLAAAGLARQAGFDGVDLRCCGDNLLQRECEKELAGDHARLTDSLPALILQEIGARYPDLILAVRLCAFAARSRPPGMGTSLRDHRQPDLQRLQPLLSLLQQKRVSLLNITANHPNLRAKVETAAASPLAPEEFPHEHPLSDLGRRLQITAEIKKAVPGMALVAGGFSWLRHLLPQVASGALEAGIADLIGLGRPSLAYPGLAADLLAGRAMDEDKCCNQCSACVQLRAWGAPAGCLLHDPGVYGREYRRQWRFSAARMGAEARRCLQCRPASCVSTIPGRPDIPAMLGAYARGDLRRAGAVLRQGWPLPEMCSQLAPYSASGEMSCALGLSQSRPLPLRELAYEIAMAGRQSATPPRLPPATGRRIAVIGGGPCGIAATLRLLAEGHAVTLYEKTEKLGGVPELLIPEFRYAGADEEINLLLAPALHAGQLQIHYRTGLGRDIGLPAVKSNCDAVLLATGLWREQSLGEGEGIFSGLDFLRLAKAGQLDLQSRRAALLGGDDCAMDAACVLKDMGLEQVFILFPGSRSQMHWCLEENWFNQPGVQAMMLHRPLSYRLDRNGKVCAVLVGGMEIDRRGKPKPRPGGEFLLGVDTVVEAMQLRADLSIADGQPELHFGRDNLLKLPGRGSCRTRADGIFAAGALVNGGESVPACVVEGTRAAGEICRWLKQEGASGDG